MVEGAAAVPRVRPTVTRPAGLAARAGGGERGRRAAARLELKGTRENNKVERPRVVVTMPLEGNVANTHKSLRTECSLKSRCLGNPPLRWEDAR
eukprot:4040919-Prymnesium_polylepis.1